jgi:hypothetical protein
MFTKKPLGGVSCASCERNITNLQGVMADFQPWKKLPFREPGDRIARVKYIDLSIIVRTWFFKDLIYDEARVIP